ncbi:MAG: NAD(P)H-hydrate epimerase [Chloroflexota bacterium]
MTTNLPTLTIQQAHILHRMMTEQFHIDPQQTDALAAFQLATLARQLLVDEDDEDSTIEDLPIVIVAGPSEKGIIGLEAARHLANWGAWVQILLTHPTDDYVGEDAQRLLTLQEMSIPHAWADDGWELPPCDLVIDAMFDAGESDVEHRDLIALTNSTLAPIVSINEPSSIEQDEYAATVQASSVLITGYPTTTTVTQLSQQSSLPDLYIADIGIPQALYEELKIDMPVCFIYDSTIPIDLIDGQLCYDTL